MMGNEREVAQSSGSFYPFKNDKKEIWLLGYGLIVIKSSGDTFVLHGSDIFSQLFKCYSSIRKFIDMVQKTIKLLALLAILRVDEFFFFGIEC